MTAVAWCIVAAVLLAAVGWGIWRTILERRRMRQISEMLDAVLAGQDLKKVYDESVLSAVEQQLARFLSANQLAEQKLQTGRPRSGR